MEVFKIITLILSGLLLTMVGLSRLSNPIKTYSKNSGINLENDVNLLNEIRGISAIMFITGLILLLGTFISELSIISFAVGVLIFLGFALGRLISFTIDGKPNPKIIQGLVFELVLGIANAFCLILFWG